MTGQPELRLRRPGGNREGRRRDDRGGARRSRRSARTGRLGDDRRVDAGRHLPDLATDPLRHSVPWGDVHVWWGDDRYVPGTTRCRTSWRSTRSCCRRPPGRARPGGRRGHGRSSRPGRLHPAVQHPRPADERCHRPAAGAEWVAERYVEELRLAGLATGRWRAPGVRRAVPRGRADGHLLSVFPGSPLLESAAWASAVPAPTHVEPHVARMSLNPGIVGAARLPIMVVYGAEKADILASVFGAERDARRWPAQFRPAGGRHLVP